MVHFKRPDRTVRFDIEFCNQDLESPMPKVLVNADQGTAAAGEAEESLKGTETGTVLRAFPGGPSLERPSPADEARSERPVAPQDAVSDAAPRPAAPKRGGRRLALAGALVIAVAAIGGYFGHGWWTHGRFVVSTDDAYVSADTAVIAPKVAGYIKSVPVADNARVTAGTPLLFIDDSDYRLALQQAEAQVAVQQAAVSRIGEQISAGEAQVAQARAELASAEAGAANAKIEYDRAAALADKSFGTQKAVDSTRAELLQANAAVDAASAGVTTAEANAAVLSAQKTEGERVLDQDKLAVDKAKLDLDHTIVRAPFDGVVGNRAAEPGEYVQPGTRLMALVPLQDIYVDANFKETQLADLRPGQTADISVDAFPDHDIKGTVESIAPASGSVFSLLPPDNATGNFTKVVQRLAVRVRVPATVAAADLVRPGMSVVVAVDTRTGTAGVASR
jgi:membrane fusion protein, multidrug efflux system